MLLVGLSLFGISLGLVVRAGLGLAPWDVFHEGVSERLDLSLGTVIVATSFVVLLLWIPLRERPGVGTIGNAILVGVWVDITMAVTRRSTARSSAASPCCCSACRSTA